MPNWCNNSVNLTHTDPAMIERARNAFMQANFLNEFVPKPAGIVALEEVSYDDTEARTLLEASNREQYGYKDWFDFCTNEWGTKWDVAGQVEDMTNGLYLTFDSAWGPPTAAYSKLLEQGFKVSALYYEPGMGFAGIWANGTDDSYDLGGMDSAAVKESLPAELDDAFDISEQMADWEEEQEED